MTGNSDNNIIEECNFYFPSASKRMLGVIDGLGTPNVTELEGNADNNHILKCLFENSEGEALRIKGDDNKIENNYFHHIDWSVSDLESLMVSILCTGDDNIFDNNTIHTTGAPQQFFLEKDPYLVIIISLILVFYNLMVLCFRELLLMFLAL